LATPTSKRKRRKGAAKGGGSGAAAANKDKGGQHPTTRDKLMELFRKNPEKEYAFGELAGIFNDVSEKTISSILTDLRDNRTYEFIFQPRHGYWKFRDRRNSLSNGNREEDLYRFKHFVSMMDRMKQHPEIFSEFDLDGFVALLRDQFTPALLDTLVKGN
jgi:hypothetical protein